MKLLLRLFFRVLIHPIFGIDDAAIAGIVMALSAAANAGIQASQAGGQQGGAMGGAAPLQKAPAPPFQPSALRMQKGIQGDMSLQQALSQKNPKLVDQSNAGF